MGKTVPPQDRELLWDGDTVTIWRLKSTGAIIVGTSSETVKLSPATAIAYGVEVLRDN